MAKANNGIFGNLSGRIGNVVGYIVNGEQYFRARPGKRNGKPTTIQQAYQEKFAMAAKIVRPFKQLFRETYTDTRKKTSALNNAQSHIIKNVIGSYPHLDFDWAQFKICNGNFPPDSTCKARIKPGKIIFSWDVADRSFIGKDHPYVIPILVAYFPALTYCNFKIGGSDYEDGVSYLNVEGLEDQQAHVYMAFASKDLKYKTGSVYLGEMRII